MYEPYGEGKGFRAGFSGLKEKIIEKLKSLRQNKWFFVIIAVIIIGVSAAYTGLVSYTAKITEYDSRISILDKQLKACNNTISSCLTDLDITKNDLESFKNIYQTCTEEKQDIETNLQSCNDEKEELKTGITDIQSTVSEWESKYERLQDDYNTLEDEHRNMEKNYAKGCCTFGFSYYFVKNGVKVVCCSKEDIDYCAEKPDNVNLIKSANC